MSAAALPHIDLSATCACGAVAITAHGPVLAMLLCSCLDCQRSTGTGHSAVAMLASADVTIIGRTKTHVRPADSGALFTRSFCPECGTPLLGHSSRAPLQSLLPIGLFGANADWFVPNQLIFARSHQHWDHVLETLPQHDRYRQSPP